MTQKSWRWRITVAKDIPRADFCRRGAENAAIQRPAPPLRGACGWVPVHRVEQRVSECRRHSSLLRRRPRVRRFAVIFSKESPTVEDDEPPISPMGCAARRRTSRRTRLRFPSGARALGAGPDGRKPGLPRVSPLPKQASATSTRAKTAGCVNLVLHQEDLFAPRPLSSAAVARNAGWRTLCSTDAQTHNNRPQHMRGDVTQGHATRRIQNLRERDARNARPDPATDSARPAAVAR
jgi:hypothetical protein